MLRLIVLAVLATAVHALDIDALWDYANPALSEQRFTAELSKAGNDRALRADLLLQIAKAQGLQAQYANAALTLDQLPPLLAGLPANVSARYAIERGRLLQLQGDGTRAWRWFHGALMLAQKDRLDLAAIEAMQLMAASEHGKVALDWNLKALALAESSPEPHAVDWQGTLYNNIGWLYYDLKDKTQALNYLRRAQGWHEQHGTAKSLLVARWSLARMRRLSGEPDKALPIQLDLERAWSKLNIEDGYVLEEIGECLLALARGDEARPYFARAFAALSHDDWLAQHEPARLERLRRLGS
jgi:tetratricopeptide (TPR) repeat protein